jgi:preprotein translocase subunit YajC
MASGRRFRTAAPQAGRATNHIRGVSMDFLISPAFAQAAPGQQPSMMPMLIMMVMFFFIFWLIAIRPQMKKAKEHRAMLAALARGDEVMAAAGLLGRVEEVGESIVTIELAQGVSIKVQKQAVTAVLPKGTLKSA